MGRYTTVDFDHDDVHVRARVYLGTTTARGDDRDEIISLNVEGKTYLSKGEEMLYEELAIIAAKEQGYES